MLNTSAKLITRIANKLHKFQGRVREIVNQPQKNKNVSKNKLSQKIKKFNKNITREGVKMIKSTTNFQIWLKKHSDTLLEQTKTKPQETLDFILNKQMESFLFNNPINHSEEGK